LCSKAALKTMSDIYDRCVVYTDGACSKNGCVDAKAGSGVFFAEGDKRNDCFTVPGRQTNQRAELWAIIMALKIVPETVAVCVISDSMYSINCATKKWKARSNLDLFDVLWKQCENRNIVWEHCRGHKGIPGNEAADKLARSMT
jgi:ribonuclease HI